MAELYIRLAKECFIGGETLYGAVYLNVRNPTSAVGVKLKILGYEHYIYSNFQSSDPDERERYFQDTKEYIQCPDIQLYNADGPIALGYYVFPFQTSLPKDLPATFELSSTTGVTWEAKVAYFVETSLTGAETIHTKKEFFIHQNSLNEDDEHALEAHHDISVPGMFGRLSMVPVSVTARLNKAIYNINETAQLSLSFDVKGAYKPKVLFVDVKVMRDFAIVFRKKSEERCSKSKDSRNSLIDFFLHMCEGMVTNLSDPDTFVLPEGPSVLVRQIHMVEQEEVKFLNGMSVLVPINDTSGKIERFPPSTFGIHVFCTYKICIDIAFKGAKPFTMTVHVPCVRIPYDKYDRALPPDWTSNCSVVSGDHSHTVPSNILDSEIFSRMPSFHVL